MKHLSLFMIKLIVIYFQAGTSNYKPPIERSKSAPKLTSIEEVEFEDEDIDEYEDGEDEHHLHSAVVELHHVASVDPVKFRLHEEDNAPHFDLSRGAESSPRVPPFPGSTHIGTGTLFLTEESDEDEITDYLGDAEADSAQSSSPASQGRSTGSIHESSTPSQEPDCHSLSDQSDPGGAEGLDQGIGKIKVSDQDTISDESGYSEEPISGRDVTVVRVNGNEPIMTAAIKSGVTGLTISNTNNNNNNCTMAVNNEHKLNINLNQGDQFPAGLTITSHSIPVGQTPPRRNSDSYISTPPSRENNSSVAAVESESLPPQLSPSAPGDQESSPTRSQPSPVKTPSPSRLTDLSVKSVLLSEFSASDRLKYIERSNIHPTKSPLVLNRQEFCINI